MEAPRRHSFVRSAPRPPMPIARDCALSLSLSLSVSGLGGLSRCTVTLLLKVGEILQSRGLIVADQIFTEDDENAPISAAGGPLSIKDRDRVPSEILLSVLPCTLIRMNNSV